MRRSDARWPGAGQRPGEQPGADRDAARDGTAVQPFDHGERYQTGAAEVGQTESEERDRATGSQHLCGSALCAPSARSPKPRVRARRRRCRRPTPGARPRRARRSRARTAPVRRCAGRRAGRPACHGTIATSRPMSMRATSSSAAGHAIAHRQPNDTAMTALSGAPRAPAAPTPARTGRARAGEACRRTARR